MNFIKEWAGTVALVILAISGFANALPDSASLGSTANGGKVTDYDAVNTIDGYFVDTTQIINAAGYLANALGLDVASSTSNIALAGSCTSTTTPASAVLSSNDFDTESCFTSSMGVGSVTETFPAASDSTTWNAWGFTASGICRDLVFENTTTTPDISLTLAAGANMNIYNASTSLILYPARGLASSTALLHLCRTGTTANPAYVGYLFNGAR